MVLPGSLYYTFEGTIERKCYCFAPQLVSPGNDHQWLWRQVDLIYLLIEIYTTTSQVHLHNKTKRI